MRNCSQLVSIALVFSICAGIAQAGSKRKQNKDLYTRVEVKAIQPDVTYRVSREVGAGRLVKADPGKPGEVVRTYHLIEADGKIVGKTLDKEERIEPHPIVFLIGRAGFSVSRGSFVRRKVLTMSATGYPANVGGSGRTATGRKATFGVVAVDPRTIRLGSLLFVEGYGLALACDTGGAIRGNRIDLCFDSRGRADSYGRHSVKVHILN